MGTGRREVLAALLLIGAAAVVGAGSEGLTLRDSLGISAEAEEHLPEEAREQLDREVHIVELRPSPASELVLKEVTIRVYDGGYSTHVSSRGGVHYRIVDIDRENRTYTAVSLAELTRTPTPTPPPDWDGPVFTKSIGLPSDIRNGLKYGNTSSLDIETEELRPSPASELELDAVLHVRYDGGTGTFVDHGRYRDFRLTEVDPENGTYTATRTSR